jgi:hypothetical protein
MSNSHIKPQVTQCLAAFAALVLMGCSPSFRHAGPAPALPLAHPTPQLIVEGLRHADLVVLGTPDTLTPEELLASSLQIGRRDTWWNARVTFEEVAKGNPGRARLMDYGNVPVWVTPPRPFPLAKNQIMVQLSSLWQTAPVVIGERAIYFFKKCYNCVELPSRTDRTTTASPWFALLTLTPEHWPAVLAAWRSQEEISTQRLAETERPRGMPGH